LADKRGHTDGAAMFCILPRERDPGLLRLLVAYELLWDFLDSCNEHGAEAGQKNGLRLHLALVDAVDLNRVVSDYYRYHPWRHDGGYLHALVTASRERISQLSSYARIRTSLVGEAVRAQVLGLNHDPDPNRRDQSLQLWAEKESTSTKELTWFELSGAASASLTIHSLLALATEIGHTDTEFAGVRRAYFQISALTTMLDSYVDQVEDRMNGDHSYVDHYPSPDFASRRIVCLIRRSMTEAAELDRGEHHKLLIACMVAMYLSKDSARTSNMRVTTHSFVLAGGPLTRLLLPVLRLWRTVYSQRSA
jgi:tetraprenyl-beta-curcumene synthase